MRVLLGTVLIALSTVALADARFDPHNQVHYPYDKSSPGRQYIQTSNVSIITLSDGYRNAEATAEWTVVDMASLPPELQGGWFKSTVVTGDDNNTPCTFPRGNNDWQTLNYTATITRHGKRMKGKLSCLYATITED